LLYAAKELEPVCKRQYSLVYFAAASPAGPRALGFVRRVRAWAAAAHPSTWVRARARARARVRVRVRVRVVSFRVLFNHGYSDEDIEGFKEPY